MSPAAPHASTPHAADRAAGARALTERQMARLERLAEIGMEIAEAAGLAARAQAHALAEGGEGGEGASGADPGLTYSRAARAVRLTIALQCRLTEALAARDQADARARAADAARRRDRIHRRVEAAAEAERGEGDEADDLSSCAWERLTETEDDDILALPFEEAVARICRDLGLAPAAFVARGLSGGQDAACPVEAWPSPGAGAAEAPPGAPSHAPWPASPDAGAARRPPEPVPRC